MTMTPVLLSEIQPKLYLSLACVASALPCVLLGWTDRTGPGRQLALGTAGFAAAVPVLLFKQFLPHLPVAIGANAVVYAAMTLLWLAAARLCGRERGAWLVGVVPAAWVACWLWPLFAARLDVRIAVAAVMTGILATLATAEVVRGPERGVFHRALAVVGGLHVAMSAGRFCFAVTGGAFGRSAFWTLCTELNLLNYVVLWPALCLMLLNQRLVRREAERATHDALSGLLNREGFLGRAVRHPQASVLLFDIDRFKLVNDTFGHACGDAVIAAFAALGRRLLGPNTVFGRLGGEEFAALVEDGGAQRAEQLADVVRAAFECQALPCGSGVTVSVGIAHPVPGERDAIETRLSRADRALYRAKRLGRNRVETWTRREEGGAAFRVLAEVE
ncbi:MAG: GGDEF domain-containing protein [Gluconacetobacter diazotrophicus]|nr:GGDEF domain-containing protein [Gluconacetobacter diazotrophicus]